MVKQRRAIYQNVQKNSFQKPVTHRKEAIKNWNRHTMIFCIEKDRYVITRDKLQQKITV